MIDCSITRAGFSLLERCFSSNPPAVYLHKLHTEFAPHSYLCNDCVLSSLPQGRGPSRRGCGQASTSRPRWLHQIIVISQQINILSSGRRAEAGREHSGVRCS
ncbi:hypothetical protein SKAU_G00279390 [Synaphobranchus kaupii]|uniref:Uncharacterized protein n=1 Tax=Synaphobranchus kaupii TaxID=118154 RepID=A0A9Q1INV6_SYNKA|nr:hypothetical protein SKAU_G00279390 [Synaphobranchus kaupii]